MALSPFFAKVKGIISGDTLLLCHPQRPQDERTFSLAYVTSPHMRREGDEPFAFQSREFLREKLIGQMVHCTPLYTVPTLKREFGTVQYGGKDGPMLPDEALKWGWLKVRDEAGRKDDDEETLTHLDKLRSLQDQARLDDLGLWAGSGGYLTTQHDLGGPSFLDEYKGKLMDGIVERVLSGDRVLLRLLASESKHFNVMTLVAGIRTPTTERTLSDGSVQPAEPFSNEAKKFVEERLHQRAVKVFIAGMSNQGQLIASLLHPRGDISVFLLEAGLARCNDFHSTMLGEKMAALRAAEKKAQSQKLNLHTNHVSRNNEGSTSDMIVSRIVSADTIFVRTKAGTEEKRISLSSIRAPRVNEPSEAPFRDMAKEYLRKKLIGKHVRMVVNGHKPASDGFEARDIATITEKGKNINLALVEDGWASVIRHRADDSDRAPNYDELLAMQEKAKSESKGMWSDKAPKGVQYTDMSESVQKAKIQLSTLQRQRKISAIVDFCKAGSRFTVLIPRENAKITLVLGGIRAPRAPRNNGEGGEPFGQEALDLANRRCNQRDCEIDVHDIDKVGGFIGDLYINRESFAKILVEEGLASVHAYSAEKSGNATELFAAESRAKEGRKGMWHSWDPSQDQDDSYEEPSRSSGATGAAADVVPDKKPSDYREVFVTHIDENGRLKLQQVGSGSAALETMMSTFQTFHNDPRNNSSLTEVKVGDFVAAKFVDNRWYRGRVRSNDRTAKVADVVYIDYGNSQKIPWTKLRPLTEQFSKEKLRPQAVDALLAFVQLPTATHYLSETIDALLDETDGKKLVALFDHVDVKEGMNYVSLYMPGAGPFESLNRDLVGEGLAMVARKPKPWERNPAYNAYLKALKETESQAKSDRRGMWEYGDITED
ncbi:nuclease domain-containing protein 1 [Ceratocystis lukuohia]|uniref:Probable endonuclease LCL3 n=2 Tax=Ceratocystis TaxID=5157 RepID=A0A0F8CY45_CERFI|nr:nuclease domain-containing protein 1 [Ceratocystis platani]